ncbi:LysR substrate-binding domain-containing protein [Marilutibacter chinensis]|uniref:LysR substrate-binding domain-containing protein n=1 Tax=Marilutibacter chinensis TaxID=2912247 RepID=A0ABS9HZG4_9GAMM|nr:LysR substrate-binding domain-containing protein [Lysobacter chinensis]MCF7223577.1 LysR substrate-binding domain-containing protein [Lysobacter chinensis]
MARPPLHALLGFAAAARAGNLTRAAESMHLTVSALSHQIRGLEERLGRRLFERNSRGVRLTGDGQHLMNRVAPHLDALEQALRPYGPRHDDMLTLSMTPSMASAWLVPRLGGFLAAHPQVQISLQSTAVAIDFEREREVDAALRIGRGHWPGLVSEHLFDEWVAPVASPELVARLGPARMAGLQDWPLLGEPDDGNEQWLAWFAAHGGEPPVRYAAHFDDTEALLRAAASGVGVALGRLTRARLLIESGQLVRLSDERLRTQYAHYLVYPQRSADHAGLQAFRQWLLAEAEAYEVALEAGT